MGRTGTEAQGGNEQARKQENNESRPEPIEYKVGDKVRLVSVMFVNKISFLVTFPRDNGLLTVEFTLNETAKYLQENLVNMVKL